MKEQKESFFLSEQEEGMRLDCILTERFPQYSRTYFQEIIRRQAVWLNRSTFPQKRYRGKKGDHFSLIFIDSPPLSIEPEGIVLDILYEDKELLLINKPAGMVVHPAPGARSGTILHALIHHCPTLKREDISSRPGIVHRLDRNTSGILLAAKSRQIQEELSRQFALRKVKKSYLAITYGKPKTLFLNAPLKRSAHLWKKMTPSEEGKEAITRCTLLENREPLSLLEVFPETGRTHQIRVHLSHAGAPIVGDELYGKEWIQQKYEVDRQLLHARKITFHHPRREKTLCFQAPLPSDMRNFLRQQNFAFLDD